MLNVDGMSSRMRGTSATVIPLLSLVLLAVHPTHSDSPAVPTRAVIALQVDEAPHIDGFLSEPAWRETEVADEFFRALQARGAPARLRTEAFVLYDETVIYIGFRCWEPNMAGLRRP